MDAESVEAGDKNHLNNVLSETEIANLPNGVANKINTYIDTKFEEYMTSKALLETSKTQIDDKITAAEATILELKSKYEVTSKKFQIADETVAELEKQVGTLTADLNKANEKIVQLENEIISLKNARDAAVDERNDLTHILERRNAKIEMLIANETSLSEQLRAAIDSKCEALTLNNDIQSKELALQYREKRMEQERVLLNTQIASLTEEVNSLTSELQTHRLNNTSRLVGLEAELSKKTEELKSANDTIEQLNEMKKKLTDRAENLSQRLVEQRDIEKKITENYKTELEAKTKLADLLKTMHDDSEAKATELSEGISELQKLLNEATEKYGELETKYKQAEKDHEELMEKKNEVISSLKNELEHANDLIKAAAAQNLDMALSDLAPSAATASKLLKSGMSLTQIYSQLVKVTDDLSREKEENRRLTTTINNIVQELEERAPMLQKQRAEYEETLDCNSALSQQIELLTIECNRLRDDYNEASRLSNHYNRENVKLKGELADLGRQVCFLLKEIEHSRGGLLNGDHDASHAESNTSNASDNNSSRIMSKTLVTFSDIQELQSNNQKLLRMIRELTDKQEELEKHKEQFETGEMQNKIDSLKTRISELTEAQDRQTKMVTGLIRQRDMFKKLYHDHMKGKRHELSSVLDTSDLEKGDSFEMDQTRPEKTSKPSQSDVSLAFEIKYNETEKQLELLKEEFKTYKEEKVTNERMLFEQIDNMRQEISKLTAANSKFASTAEFNNERLKILQTNIATYKKQISSLEEKNKTYNATIAKHEVSLQHLRDEALNSQNKLATAEIQLENLKLECKLLKDTEHRLQTEKEILNRERQGQSLLLKNLELVKASVERLETENRTKIESRLDEATRECSAIRMRLQEEQNRFRELASHLERQTETAKERMEEEKKAADVMRKEITILRNDLSEKNKANEELARKLKEALDPNVDNTLESLKKIKELENKISDKDGEIKSLTDQLNNAKEHVKQYCDISEGAEKGIKSLSDEYDTYKTATEIKLAEYSQKVQQLEEKCSELEAELSLQNNGEYASININLKNELANCKQELAVALSNLESNRTDLESARAEITKLSEAVQKAEDKYTHEMILHSSDIQTLAQTKEELSRVQNELNELVALKNQTLEKLEVEKASWLERQKSLTKENEELVQRFKDICEQNSVLHDQIQALGTQLSVAHASRSHSESLNESANDSNMSVSVNEDDAKSSEQMYRIVKFLRKEKDIALAKFDILQAETMRLRSQLEITEKQLDEAKLTLAAEREKYEVSLVTVNRQSDILRKVETLDALTDSNRVLREERDTLASRVEELTKATKALEEQLHPLQESVADLTSKNETLQSENTSLKSDCARWRTRVNALVERANKTSPEDWKRLQNERETLAKMLTNEKEALKKVNEELGALKIEKTKLEEQYTILSRQQNQLVEENKKLNEEVQTLKDDMARLTEELTKIKAAHDNLSETNVKLLEDLNDKDASLSDIRNKELQIRKIAKKYKGQYEELVKTVDEDKKKSEGEAAAAGVALAETSKKMEDQLSDLQGQVQGEKASNEKLKQELETLRTANMDREEKAKQVLKQAKSKIVQLTESKNSLSREVDELRSKIGAIEQSTREELEVRIALLKSQYDGRLSRLEKEKTEVQTEKTREVEALLQKVNMLQRQLANQSSAGKQQATTEKVTSDPPTANIKPMAGVAQQSVTASRRGGETPLASIRPMAQVGPTAPHDAHTTEYMPASSSRPLQRAALAPAASASASATSAVAATSASASAPPESTQDMDTSEAGMGSSGSSDNNAQSSSHSQAPQQAVALVMPRIEVPSGASGATTASAAGSSPAPSAAATPAPTAAQPGASSATPTSAAVAQTSSGVSTSHTAPGVSTSHVVPGVSTSHAAPGVSTSHAAPGVSTSQAVPGVSTSNAPPGVSTSHPPTETRPAKRRLQARPVSSKRTRVQGFERSVEVEYQVPTSSRCDQDDEGVIVVDSEEDDERCTGTMYREAEDDEEDMEEEQEEEGGEEEEAEGDDGENAATQDSPAQSPEAGGAGEEGDDGEDGEEVEGREAGGAAADAAREADSEPAPHHPQIEAISSGTEPSGALSLGGSGGDDGDDSIVPSTPTLYVPRRNDGFGEAVVSPLGAGGDAEAAGGARFTFAEGAASHHDTHADLAAALPPPHAAHAPQPHTARSHTDRRSEGTESQWEESRAEEEAAAVSSQGSEPSSPQQIAEEGREAEASSPAPVLGTRRPAHSPAVHSPHQRWMRAADSESGARGRGLRPRGRPPRRSHYMRF
ncbi:PREDICTED: nucleoprotein TPR-like isoform X2 [Papilio xuthus]|uniref:Nucleoprotein TPR n=1 Tax=Papilio xuthus TaxID=66420 RepID=A0AAJ6ZGJ1_PAPXU|nr:PREDICTED: nucleoprotein TPR-like isoform X2 [Papilio xuthus]